MPKIRQTNKVMKVGNQWLPAFLNSVNGSPTYTYMNDSGQWADASGNTYNVEHPLDEVTVKYDPKTGGQINKAAPDYWRQYGQRRMHQRTDGLEGVVLGYPLMFTRPGAMSMIAGYGADEALKWATEKSFDQYGREYITPYLQKLGVASDVAGDVGGFLGNMSNPGYLIGSLNRNGLKIVNAAATYPTSVRQRLVEMALRSTSNANPLPDIMRSFSQDFGIPYVKNAYRKLNNSIFPHQQQGLLKTIPGAFDPTRFISQVRYLLTGTGSGPMPRYRSFAPFSHKHPVKIAQYPTYYTGFVAPDQQLIKPGVNDLIDAFVYQKPIDKRYGLKLIGKGLDFEGVPGYVNKYYSAKAKQIPTYEVANMQRPIFSDNEISGRTPFTEIDSELGIYDVYPNKVNAGGHRIRLGLTPENNTAAQEQDIFKFNPSEYIAKWNPGEGHGDIYNRILKKGLQFIDKNTTPVITKTPWYEVAVGDMR